MRQGTNSLCPRISLLVRSPEATRRSISKILRPTSRIVSFPVNDRAGVDVDVVFHYAGDAELVEILITGTTGNPMPLPRPVVKQIRFDPPAAMPVSETGS